MGVGSSPLNDRIELGNLAWPQALEARAEKVAPNTLRLKLSVLSRFEILGTSVCFPGLAEFEELPYNTNLALSKLAAGIALRHCRLPEPAASTSVCRPKMGTKIFTPWVVDASVW